MAGPAARGDRRTMVVLIVSRLSSGTAASVLHGKSPVRHPAFSAAERAPKGT